MIKWRYVRMQTFDCRARVVLLKSRFFFAFTENAEGYTRGMKKGRAQFCPSSDRNYGL